MSQVAILPPNRVGPKDPYQPVHLEPAAQVPQGWFNLEAWLHWIKGLFASLGDLLLPEVIEREVAVVPTLAKAASYDVFQKFVYNELDSRQDLVERSITQLREGDQQGLEIEMGRVGAILKMVAEAGEWIKAHQAEFNGKKLEAVQINQKLLRSQRLVGELLKRLPHTEDLLQPAPRNWLPQSLEAPGIRNQGNDCFMNSCIHGVFGDPAAYRWIALNKHQHERIRIAAFQYRHACALGQTTPLTLAQGIRNLFPLIKGTDQHEAHVAFNCFVDALTGTDMGVQSNDNYAKDRREYAEGNPFVHKITRRATYDGIDMGQVQDDIITNFQGNVHVTDLFDWCPIIPLEGTFESNAFESLLEAYLRPTGDRVAHFSFKMKDGQSKQDHPATTEVNTFEKLPERGFFSFKRTNGKLVDGQYRYFRSSDPIELGETFYIDPKHTATGEGGMYAVTYFACHGGSVDPITGRSGGHYIAYRKVGDEWFYYSDTSKRAARIDEVRQALKTRCELFSYERIHKELTPEEVSQGVKTHIRAAKEAQLEREMALLNAPLPKGDTIDVKDNHLKRIKIFNTLLNKEEAPPAAKLFDAFQKTPPEFQALMHQLLILEGKMGEKDSIKDHLLELKEIVKQYLTTKLNGHIVSQYCFIREKQLKLVQDEIAALTIQREFLRHEKHAQAANSSIDALMTRVTFNISALALLSARLEDTEQGLVLQIGELLFPGLGKVIAERQNVGELEVAPTVAAIFAALTQEQTTFIARLRLQQEFNTLLGA